MAAIGKAGGFMLLTADHGNIELMKDQETGEPFTQHTIFDVPIVVYGAPIPKGAKLENGRLADIAPTMLALMGIEQPKAMTGHCLLAGVSAKKEKV
jgi:2,3-bisphosphoglycerate-independent phosphoglycerate mutase